MNNEHFWKLNECHSSQMLVVDIFQLGAATILSTELAKYLKEARIFAYYLSKFRSSSICKI